MDLIKLLQEGDATGLEMQKALEALEQAKKVVEQAKERFDSAKSEFEQVVARADEAGVPRAKFKKLVEERVAGLWSSGLIAQSEDKTPKAPKPPRAPKKAKDEVIDNEVGEVEMAVSKDEVSTTELAMMN